MAFGDIALKLGRDGGWVAALCCSQTKADAEDLSKLAKILNLEASAVSSLTHESPARG